MSGQGGPNWREAVEAALVRGEIAVARTMLETWVGANPGDADAHRQLARILLHLGEPEAGLGHARQAAVTAPDAPGLFYEIGVLSLTVGRLDEAEAAFRREIAADSGHADALFNLGWVLRRQKRHAEAAAAFQGACALRPGWGAAWFNLGNSLMDESRPEEAVVAYEAAAGLAPADLDVALNLGHALRLVDDAAGAEEMYRRVLAARPGAGMAAVGLAGLLGAAGRTDEALRVLTAATAAVPDDPAQLRELGMAFTALDRRKAALPLLERAVRLAPDNPDMWNALGATRLAADQPDSAQGAFERALGLRPDHVEAINNLGKLAAGRGDVATAERCFRRILEIEPGNASVHSNLLFLLSHMSHLTRDELAAEHFRFGEIQEALVPALPPLPPDPATPPKVLRIGYVSPDFREHAVAFWFEAILAHHDHDRFEIHCYYTGRLHDAVTERLKGYADAWHPIAHWSPDRAAQAIRRDGIHILVDLAGHTAGNGLSIFVRKPAPIQATFLGYPATTGLRRMDYRIGDISSDRPENDGFFSETLELLTLAPTFRPPADVPVLDRRPRGPDAASQPRFASLNRPEKIGDAVWAVWLRLLRDVPSARFVMIAPGSGVPAIRENYLARFTAAGIAADRIELHDMLDLRRFLDLVATVDVALDPFPYSGGTTTLLTLWMGVPVLTMAGYGSAAEGWNPALGIGDFVAADEAAYVAAAVAAAAPDRLARLARLRPDMRNRMSASLEGNEVAYTRQLEKAYESWWLRHMTGAGGTVAGVTETAGFEAVQPILPPFAACTAFGWLARGVTLTEGDASYHEDRSRTVLLEDGQPLGPPHSSHSFIDHGGRGRYSHWETFLCFSTSDNSDPRTNGRIYQIARARPIPRPDHGDETTLVAFYDLAVEPITHEFLWFMAHAELERRRRGLSHGKVVLISGWHGDLGYDVAHLTDPIPPDRRRQLLTELIAPLIRLFSHWSGEPAPVSRQAADHLVGAARHRFPADYHPAIPALSHVHAPRPVLAAGPDGQAVVVPSDALRIVADWLADRAGGRRVVAITIRDDGVHPGRNSALSDWLAFAGTLDPGRYFPVFVPDERVPLPAAMPYGVFPQGAGDPLLRAALYELAFLNMGINSGPMQLCILNRRCNFLLFRMINEGMRETATDFLVRRGLPVGTGWPLTGPGQRLVWENDDLAVLLREFSAMATELEARMPP